MAGAQLGIERIRSAQQAGARLVKRTPVITSAALSELAGGPVVLKAENLQRTGSFKIRGAASKLADLGPAAAAGVTAGSAGNHAQALAFAARAAGVRCEIFVPSGAPLSKVEACRGYGATLVEGGQSVEDAVAAARQRAEATGMVFCHPFDDLAVIAGQGVVGLELIDEIEDLAQVVVPLGGGGLAAGLATAVKAARPSTRVIAVQAEACAPYLDHPAGRGPVLTLADGIAVKRPGRITRPLVERLVDEIATVDEDSIADAMVLLMERAKLVVEGAGAVGVAALLSGAVAAPRHGTTCVVLSGGNVDLGVTPGLIRRHETRAGRRLIVFARIGDRPGTLAKLLALFAEAGANLIEVEHVREGIDLHVRQTGVQAVLEVRGPSHAAAVLAAAREAGYDVEAPTTMSVSGRSR